jgi:hypothetical protein
MYNNLVQLESIKFCKYLRKQPQQPYGYICTDILYC